MDYFHEYIIKKYNLFINIITELKNESNNTLNKYGGF